MFRRLLTVVVGAFAFLGCGDGVAPVLHSDIERARADWLASRPPSYLFEVTIDGMSGKHRHRITVENHVVVSAVQLGGGSVQSNLTIEEIWTYILRAAERNQVNSVLFDGRGIPVYTDVGVWALDSGVFYEITRFNRR